MERCPSAIKNHRNARNTLMPIHSLSCVFMAYLRELMLATPRTPRTVEQSASGPSILSGNERGGILFSIFITDPLFHVGKAVWRHPSCVYIYLPKWNVCFIVWILPDTRQAKLYQSSLGSNITNRSRWWYFNLENIKPRNIITIGSARLYHH